LESWHRSPDSITGFFSFLVSLSDREIWLAFWFSYVQAMQKHYLVCVGKGECWCYKGMIFNIDLLWLLRKSFILAKINYPVADAVFDQRAREV
jgi:hypothetical protein